MENFDQILDAQLPSQETPRLRYAGFFIRFGAWFVDIILILIVNAVIGAIFGSVPALSLIVTVAADVCYFAFMESSESQGTLGKMSFGIKVGDANGEQISTLNAVGRYFAKILSGLFLCIGYLMVAWDEKSQGLHDKLAETYVFYK